jgi:hypothetical protein
MSSFQTKLTSKFLKDLLQGAQKEIIPESQSPEGLNIDEIWKALVGEKMAALTQVKSFHQGILIIKVTSASLCQLLSTSEKPKILARLRADYSFVKVKNLIFRTG